MRISAKGLEFLTALEGGMRLDVHDDGYGYPTVGVGHLIVDSDNLKYGDTITRERALEFLRDDVREAEDAVNNFVVPVMAQHEFDALVCFCFNIGVGAFRRSTLVRRLANYDMEAVREELPRWSMAGGRRSKGLLKRRRETAELFYDGDYVRHWHALGDVKHEA